MVSKFSNMRSSNLGIFVISNRAPEDNFGKRKRIFSFFEQDRLLRLDKAGMKSRWESWED